MTVLAAMQSAAVRLIGRKPTAFFGASSANVFELEITDLLNEVAWDIIKSHDWQVLTKFATIHADGSQTVFDLPDDYERMLVKSDIMESEGWFWGYDHLTDINEFKYRAERGFNLLPGAWTMFGNQLHFAPAPTTDAQYPYISRCFARDSVTLQNKCDFDADTDEFLLPERLLTLGLVWRWRENKKLDWTGDQEAFVKALGEYAAKDGGSKVFRHGRRRSFPGTYPAWPWALGGV